MGSVGMTAAATTIGFGAITAASVVGAVATASTVAMVAYTVLATLGAGLSIAAMSAYFDPESQDAPSYLGRMTQHAGMTVPGMVQFVVQSMFQALVQGITAAISNRVERRFS